LLGLATWDEVVVEVEHPAETVAQINRALAEIHP
jgi:hypothetical protein